MLEFLLIVVCLGAFIWGLLAFLKARRKGTSRRPALATLIGSPLLFLIVAAIVGSRLPAEEAVTTPPAKAPVAATPEPAQPAAVKPAPEPTPEPEAAPVTPPPAVESTPEPVAETPAAPPGDRGDMENLAVIAGRPANDPELVAEYERLSLLCPPEGPTVADMVVNLRGIVKEETGREMDVLDVMRQLATAQEGGAEVGMKCTETGGALATLLIQEMQ